MSLPLARSMANSVNPQVNSRSKPPLVSSTTSSLSTGEAGPPQNRPPRPAPPPPSGSSSTSSTRLSRASSIVEDERSKLIRPRSSSSESESSQVHSVDFVKRAKQLQTRPLISNIPRVKSASISRSSKAALRQSAMKRRIAACVVAAAGILIAVAIVYFIVGRKSTVYKHVEGEPISSTYSSWASSMDEPQCAHIPVMIFEKGGTVADAAVASMLCLGVVLPESLGIGGGFLAVYFQKSTGKVHFLDAREVAPLAASTDMFNETSSREGPLSVAVPGELAGYRELLKLVGSNVTQKELFETAIKYASEGFIVGEHLANAMRQKSNMLYESEALRKVYFNELTNSTKGFGETLYNTDLAKTLQKLASANDFAYEFYNGSIGKKVVETLQGKGGILTMKDMANYRAHWRTPTLAYMKDKQYEVHSGGLSGTGSVLSMMVNVMDAFEVDKMEENVTTYQRLVEAMKFAYAQRSLLGDYEYPNAPPEFKSKMSKLVENMQSEHFAKRIREKISDTHTLDLKEYGGIFDPPRDRGTSHASFFGPNGDVIAITSTVNFYFGGGVQVDGIILNNEMDDFSVPGKANGFGISPSPTNYIQPFKRPLSSMAPAIVVKDGEAVMAIGAAGGSQITSAIMEVILHYFYMNYTIGDAIAHSRLHHQYLPEHITYDQNFDPDIIKQLEAMGHKTFKRPVQSRGSVIVAIVREGDKIIAACDPRKGGGTSGGSS